MNITVLNTNVSQQDAITLLGLKDVAEVHQVWVENVAILMHLPEERVREMFIWSYDDGSAAGYPYPLTVEAYGYLKALDIRWGLRLANETTDRQFNVLLTSA